MNFVIPKFIISRYNCTWTWLMAQCSVILKDEILTQKHFLSRREVCLFFVTMSILSCLSFFLWLGDAQYQWLTCISGPPLLLTASTMLRHQKKGSLHINRCAYWFASIVVNTEPFVIKIDFLQSCDSPVLMVPSTGSWCSLSNLSVLGSFFPHLQ